MKMPVIIAVVGPTAVGKTRVAIELAQVYQTEIVSADARQFYREMAIGTAVPSREELKRVPHHFIQSHAIEQLYSVGEYEQEALQLIDQLSTRHSILILVGGSGLYVKALLDGLDEMPAVDLEIRERLTARVATGGLPALVKQLEELDPEFAQLIDRNNPQRVIRALEVCLSTGKPYSTFRQGGTKERPFRSIRIGLELDRATLYQRIDQRVDEMLAQGLLEEARALFPFRENNALQTVGYSEIFDFLEGHHTWEEAVRLIKRNSRRYAKRQLTWFRKDPQVKWFHPDDRNGITGYINARLNLNT
jgi:tRNA dimethylallyltransferase